MRKSTLITALGALWIIASTTSPTISQAATITVFHGSKTEIFDMAKRPAGGVHVVKPISTPASTPSPVATNRATRPYGVNASFVAGGTLWTRNARTGRLVACRVRSSGMVGKHVIRCNIPDSFGR